MGRIRMVFQMLAFILIICCCLASVRVVETQAATETKSYQAKSQEDIEKYIEEAVELSQTTDAQITIELVEDTYYLTKPIEISGDSFGDYAVSICFKNKEGKTPVITGISEIPGSSFAKVEGKDYYSYSIPADADNQYPQFRDLYVNGERFTLAKSTDYVFEKNRKDDGSNCFYVDRNALKNVSSDDVSPLEIDIDMLWLHKQYRVDTVTKKEIYGFAYADTEISLVEEDFWSFPETATETNQSIKALQNFTYRFKNHLAFLDEPGEFFYDETNGTIYLYPYSDTDMEAASVGYPLVERLFLLDGASNISFEGISFTGTTYNFTTNYGYNAYQGGYHMWPEKSAQKVTESAFGGDTEAFTAWRYDVTTVGAIAGKNTENILVKNCSFDSLGTAGIDLKGTNSHVEVSGCSFTDLAMSAICLGQNNLGFEKRQTNILIDNNYIDDVSRDYRTFPGIISFQTEDVSITYNTIKKTPYSGIHLGWWTTPSVRGVEIAYNYFENCMYRGDDGGSIYVCGSSTSDTGDDQIMNRIYRNYVRCNGFSDVYTGQWGINSGIYLDNFSSNYSVYENVLTSYNSSTANIRAIRNQEGSGIETHNNIMKHNYSTMAFPCDAAVPERNIQSIRNKMYGTTEDLPDEAVAIMNEAGCKDSTSIISDKQMQVEVQVPETYMRIPMSSSTPKKSLVFTITNRGQGANTYRLTADSNGTDVSEKITMSTSVDELTLQPNESGEIAVSFASGTQTAKAMYDFTVSDSTGRKEQFERLISVRVVDTITGVPTAADFQNTDVKDYYANGVEIASTEDATYTLDEQFATLQTGARIDMLPINVSEGKSLQLTVGCYVLTYRADGQLTIRETYESVDQVRYSKTMTPIAEIWKLSVYAKMSETTSDLVVDVYNTQGELCNRFLKENISSLSGYSATDATVSFLSESDVSYRISYMGAAEKFMIGTSDDQMADLPIYMSAGEFLPTGYADTGEELLYITGWTLGGVPCVAYPTDVNETTNLIAERIDCKMLYIKWQDSNNETQSDLHTARFLSSVNSLRYQNTGIVLSTKNDQPIISNSSNKETKTVYRSVKANGDTKSVSEVYDAYSKYMFGRVLKNIPSNTPIYARAYVTLLDGTVVYGRTRTIELQSHLLDNGTYQPPIEDFDDL